MLEPFRTEPFSDFTKIEVRSAFEAALARAERAAGEEVPLVVGGRRLRTGKLLKNVNPADRSLVLSLPIVLLFFYVQKQMVGGLVSGAVKG